MQCQKCKRQFMNKGSYGVHIKSCNLSENDLNNIVKRYLEGESLRDLTKEYPHHVVLFITKGKRRSRSEANIVAHKLKPESFKCSEKTKEKLRQARLRYMKEHPESTAWRTKSMSYPEKIFKRLVKKNDLGKLYDIVYEYSIFPYFVDFAFVNIKLAIEIDGQQHWTVKTKIERDKKKNKLLLANGWKIYRIPAFKINNEFDLVEQDFLKYLMLFEKQPKIFNFHNDIIKHKQLKEIKKQQREKRKFEREKQQKELLERRKNDIKNHNFSIRGSVSKLSKLWNVTHTQVRRYLRKNNLLPTTKFVL